jgi:O-antigen ligase
MHKLERTYQFLLIVFCGIWMLLKFTVTPFIILLLLLSISANRRKENKFIFNRWNGLWMLLFVLYALSLLWSETPDYSALERKMAFVAFPLLFSFRWQNPMPIKKMWLSHTIACLVLICIAYYDALMCHYSLGQSVRCFSTTYFSQVHHPSYFSAFLLFSIGGLLFKKIAWFDQKPRWISWILIGIFSSMHYHLGTLAGVLALILMLVIYLAILVAGKWGWMRSCLLGIMVFFVGVFLALQSAEIKADANNALAFTKDYIQNPGSFVQSRTEPLQGNELRLILWTASFQEIKAHPFGLGIGGMEKALGKKLINWGYPLQAKKEFNPHNQFLQITNEIGFLGLLIFLVLLTNFGLYAIKRKDNFGMLFLMILVVFCLFESVLQRLSGVVFFICWMSALQAYWSSKSKFELQ